jgi:3-hydroxyisobutyrate dehydrogenase-like beta-hydroxyacid dehydrogenase
LLKFLFIVKTTGINVREKSKTFPPNQEETKMNTQKVAVLGLGAMGSRVAQRLLQANYPVVVFNRNVHKAKSLLAQGALWAATPKEAAQQANIVISMVTDDQASRTVWLAPETGAMAGLKPEAIAIESSTLSVAWTKALATDLTAQGTAFLDAPVVGSRPQAEAGKLIYLVGGEAATLAQVRGLLLAIGAVVHHVGATGEGMLLKLGVNALFGLQVAALAEMMAILTSYG